jgi:hypothetical protein
MTGWRADELNAIDAAETVHIAPDQDDGAHGRAARIWVVRVGNDMYIRSFSGPAARWYRRALRARRGTIRASTLEQRVRFDDAEADVQPQIDAAYQTKYAAHGSSYVKRMVGPAAVATTLRLQPIGSPRRRTDQRQPRPNPLTEKKRSRIVIEL